MRDVEIDKLVRWAYCDELPKRGVVGTVANGWDNLSSYGELLTIVDDDEMRLPAALGPPHPDAIVVETAVRQLPKRVKLSWFEFGPILMGDLMRLKPEHNPIAGDRSYSEHAIVETFARLGRAPIWNMGLPTPQRVTAANNRPKVEGKLAAPNRYTHGSYCPLQYVAPTIEQLVHRRSEYLIWRGAMERLLDVLTRLRMEAHRAIATRVPAVPWLDGAMPDAMRPAARNGVQPAWKVWNEPPPKGGPKSQMLSVVCDSRTDSMPAAGPDGSARLTHTE